MSITIYPPSSSVFTYFFDIPIRFYGLIMAFAFSVGILGVCLLFYAKKKNKEIELFIDYSPLIIFLSVIGARFFYVLGSFSFYLNNPKEIIMLNHGGLSIIGAIFFGLTSLFVFSKIKKFNFFEHCDTLAVIFPLCQAVGRFGNFFNQEAFGRATDGFLKLYVDARFRPLNSVDKEYYHPTFLYESILDFVIFLVLLFLFIRNKNLKEGTLTFLYLAFYSFIRFFIELIRIDSLVNIKMVPIVCIICFVLFFVSIFKLLDIYKKKV